jgi:hypothetical protein
MNDPIVEEIRRIRDEHAKKFGYDMAAICADIRRHQASSGHPVVRLTPKKTQAEETEETGDDLDG